MNETRREGNWNEADIRIETIILTVLIPSQRSRHSLGASLIVSLCWRELDGRDVQSGEQEQVRLALKC